MGRWTARGEHSQPGDAPSWRFLGRGRGHEQAEGEGDDNSDGSVPHGSLIVLPMTRLLSHSREGRLLLGNACLWQPNHGFTCHFALISPYWQSF